LGKKDNPSDPDHFRVNKVPSKSGGDDKMKKCVVWAIGLILAIELGVEIHNHQNLEAVSAASTAGDSNHLEVYTLAGYNVHSYVIQHEDGQPGWDGVAWDYIVMVNPRVDGEKVFIPAKQNHGREGEHFFYIDSLVREEGSPVYQIKSGAHPYVEKDAHGLEIEQDQSWQSTSGILFAPRIEQNGCNRVYLNNFESPDARRFFYRSDLMLLNPQPYSGQ
jgi:hypothetical protein